MKTPLAIIRSIMLIALITGASASAYAKPGDPPFSV